MGREGLCVDEVLVLPEGLAASEKKLGERVLELQGEADWVSSENEARAESETSEAVPEWEGEGLSET